MAGGVGAAMAPASFERPAPPPEPEPELDLGDAWLDFDALALAPDDDRARRGRLVRAEAGDGAAAQAAEAKIAALSPDSALRDPLSARGLYDHRYDAAAPVDLSSDALPHRVPVAMREARQTPRWRTSPAFAMDVYREAEIENPFEAPLLAGPVDVYVEGTLLARANIGHVDKGGVVHVGLGVEDRVRIARNVRMEEEAAGLLGGTSALTHAVGIELVSSLGSALEVTVLDRLPVTDEKGIEVKLLSASEEPKAYEQEDRGAPVRGGLSWKVGLPAGGKASLSYRYRITLPAKNELLGGNRRD
jgi:uncharacterized protein (TIGR02231 family)